MSIPTSRREFLRSSGLAAAGLPLVMSGPRVPEDSIRVGLIGCGGRGTGAALDAVRAATKVIYPRDTYHTEDAADGAKAQARGIQVVALADLFPDRLKRCRQQMEKVGHPVAEDHCFTGFDAYRKLIDLKDVDYVIHATPPHFRPLHLRAAVEAGKHSFLEKPVAVDAAGVRSVIESGEMAKGKNLGIGAGTMRRRMSGAIETTRRIREGMIGDIVACEAVWSGGELWSVNRRDDWSDMEFQLRNWLYYTWLSGDFIVEQFVHNLDTILWVVGEHPSQAFATGGRQVRTDPRFGHIYDHFAVEYVFPSGVRCFAFDRQMDGTCSRVEEIFLGTKGIARYGLFDGWEIRVKGGETWRPEGPKNNPYHQEHEDLIRSIREGKPLNEARQLAESTLTSIMGREAAYSGQTISWDAAMKAKQDLTPAKYEMGPMPVPPVHVPGKYRMS
jgi:predicted dehydrogenase